MASTGTRINLYKNNFLYKCDETKEGGSKLTVGSLAEGLNVLSADQGGLERDV